MEHCDSPHEKMSEELRNNYISIKNMRVSSMMQKLESEDVNTRKLLEVIYDEFKK